MRRSRAVRVGEGGMGGPWRVLSDIIATGALCWLVGSVQWLLGSPVYPVVLWWSAFLVFTIAGERLVYSWPFTMKCG
jgi:hypothetical protein